MEDKKDNYVKNTKVRENIKLFEEGKLKSELEFSDDVIKQNSNISNNMDNVSVFPDNKVKTDNSYFVKQESNFKSQNKNDEDSSNSVQEVKKTAKTIAKIKLVFGIIGFIIGLLFICYVALDSYTLSVKNDDGIAALGFFASIPLLFIFIGFCYLQLILPIMIFHSKKKNIISYSVFILLINGIISFISFFIFPPYGIFFIILNIFDIVSIIVC